MRLTCFGVIALTLPLLRLTHLGLHQGDDINGQIEPDPVFGQRTCHGAIYGDEGYRGDQGDKDDKGN